MYITGADFRHDSTGGIEVHQSYLEASELFGLPLTARIGRQELEFGSGWMIGADRGPPTPSRAPVSPSTPSG